MILGRLIQRRVMVLLFFILAGQIHAQNPNSIRFKAVAFDYFVIFDPDSIVPALEKEFPGKGREFARLWRTKQFDYGFLRSLTNRHENFFKVTRDALVYTAEVMHLELGPGVRDRLLNTYLHLKPWPDAVEALRKLKAEGYRLITLANFSPEMLRSNAQGAGITGFFEDLLSTEVNGTFKPDPRAYELAMKTLNLKKEDILFVAFGGWDAYGAKSFGYTTFWVNRFHSPLEELGLKPDATSPNIDGLLDYLLAKP